MMRLLKKYTYLATHFYLIGAVILWGLSWPAGKVVAQNLPPLHAAMWRFTLACSVLLVWLAISNRGLPRLNFKQSCGMVLGGFVGVFGYAYFFMAGLSDPNLSASRASLIIAFNPALTTLLAAMIFREKLTWTIGIGMLLALLGGVIVISHGEPLALFSKPLGQGELLIMGCTVTWTVYCLLGKKLMQGIPALTNITYSACAGLVFLTAGAMLFEAPASLLYYSPKTLGVLVFLGLGATVLAYVWYFRGLAALGAGAAASYSSLVPVFGVLSSMVYLGETADAALWVGGGVTLFGVALMNYARARIT
jgi:drug/metabolite transporter (DMT)-like permease